jgi:hypothetical protein
MPGSEAEAALGLAAHDDIVQYRGRTLPIDQQLDGLGEEVGDGAAARPQPLDRPAVATASR